jgi:GTP cyclohydrolase I
MESPIIKLTWPEVRSRLVRATFAFPSSATYFGIPRGGSIVAALTGRMADTPEHADVLIDDIVDSGKTRTEWHNRFPEKPFVTLWDKMNGDPRVWVQFPWEPDADKDIADTVIRQLEFIGEDPNRDGLKETPQRVIKALKELTRGYQEDPAQILSKVFIEPYDEMVVLKDIEFWSLCEHHLLPFHGKLHIGYIPSGRIIGISKLARLAECFTRRLQVQERMTQQIAQAIQTHLQPLGVGVIAEATHLCMAMRGVKEPANMVTSCLLGIMRDSARPEFLRLFNGKS